MALPLGFPLHLPLGRSEFPFRNSGWGKYKISVPDGNRDETWGILLRSTSSIVDFKKFNIL